MMIRQTFENWYSGGGKYPVAIERNGDGYKLKHANEAWASWQIAAEATALKCAEIAHNWRDVKTGISCCHKLDIEADIRAQFHLPNSPTKEQEPVMETNQSEVLSV